MISLPDRICLPLDLPALTPQIVSCPCVRAHQHRQRPTNAICRRPRASASSAPRALCLFLIRFSVACEVVCTQVQARSCNVVCPAHTTTRKSLPVGNGTFTELVCSAADNARGTCRRVCHLSAHSGTCAQSGLLTYLCVMGAVKSNRFRVKGGTLDSVRGNTFRFRAVYRVNPVG